MAETETHLEVKIFIDNEKGRFLFAESDADFVDVLFSFLTLPLGTIVRLIGKAQSEPASVGCFTTLYQSVMSLSNEHFLSEVFKDMLLRPRSSYEDLCRSLKVNIDDTEANYFVCSSPRCYYARMCFYKHTKCHCGTLMMSTVKSLVPPKYSSDVRVFVTNELKFIITDDLQVTPVVQGTVKGLLDNLGINDISVIEERTVKLGSKEILELLKLTLLSPTPLTDLFVSKNKQPHASMPKTTSLQKRGNVDRSGEDRRIDVKVVLRKSTKEFLFVEAGRDFIDFLFSFLIIPLGEVLHIMDGQSCLHAIDALYESAQSLDSAYFISQDQKDIVIRPKLPLANHYNRLFPLEATKVSFVINGVMTTMAVDSRFDASDGFLRGKTVFIVSDNLTVTPLSAAYTISIYKRHNVSVSDLEERTLSLGMAEGISILRASLNSTSAVSKGLLDNSLVFKEPKQEK